MAIGSIVKEYEHPQPSNTATLSADEKCLKEAVRSQITRPKGYTVSFHANPEVEKVHFGRGHPMKPWRMTLTNKLVLSYGMYYAMDMYRPPPAPREDLTAFHDPEYCEFLSKIVPKDDPNAAATDEEIRFGMGDDCPVFDGLYDYCTLYAGSSLDGARALASGRSDIAINWSGGLHHAKKKAASGFCYINDIVLAIRHLLLYHPRVLYIDIDVHHGDGVEQAFYSTDRVMTLSFHKYNRIEFFPGTGGLDETGPKSNFNPGAHHSLNVPLNDGIDDDSYTTLFKDVVQACHDTYRPTAIVIQCGADSLGGDRLGCFNLNIKAHGSCVAFTKSLNLPLLVLGGGGYTARNVARLWAYETAVCIGAQDTIHPALPSHTPFLEHFPEKTLFPDLGKTTRYENRNPREYLEEIRANVAEQLRYLKGAPGVQMQYVPRGWDRRREEEEARVKEEREERGVGRREREEGRGRGGEIDV